MEILQWFQRYSSAVQALVAIVVVVVTTIYVILTYKLLHSPHKAFVRPVSLAINDKGWVFKVRNYGPGLATNIQVKSVVLTKMMLEKGTLKGWTTTEFLPAMGPSEIPQYENAEYHFNYLMTFEYPVFVSWKSVTGNTQKTSWLILIKQNNKFLPLSFWGFVKFKFNWYRINILSPYYGIYKWWHFRKANQKGGDK